MGWRVIGRGVLLGALALGGCASNPRRDPAAAEGELRSAVVAVYEAVARGDEAAYRQLVRMPAGDAYSDALTSTMFESIRLHQAFERTSSTSTRPAASLAAVDYRENARAMLKAVQGWTFSLSGDRATIDQLAQRPGAPALRRVEGRWVLEPTPWDERRDTATYRLAVAQERALAAALGQARDAVNDGSAKTVEDVNAILRKLLTEPTTQPQ